MTYAKLFIGFAFLSALLIAGCGLLGSDDENGTEEISLEDLPGTLVFSARADDGNFQIFTMNPDGSELTQLTFREMEPQGESSRGFSGYVPSWSPDGEQIVFTTEYQSTTAGPALWVMNADGSDPRPLHIPYPEDHPTFALWGNNPRWSPDGRKIVFFQCTNCSVSTNEAIFVFDLDTEELTRLTEEPPGHSSIFPVWNPDGTQIAFTTNRDYVHADTLRFRQDLYVMDADGSNQLRITDTGYARFPIWRPYDHSILVRSTEPNASGLYLVNIGKDDISELKADASTRTQLHAHAWSPNGSEILTIKRELDPPRKHTIYMLDVRGNNLMPIYTQYSPNSNPAFRGADWYIPIEN